MIIRLRWVGLFNLYHLIKYSCLRSFCVLWFCSWQRLCQEWSNRNNPKWEVSGRWLIKIVLIDRCYLWRRSILLNYAGFCRTTPTSSSINAYLANRREWSVNDKYIDSFGVVIVIMLIFTKMIDQSHGGSPTNRISMDYFDVIVQLLIVRVHTEGILLWPFYGRTTCGLSITPIVPHYHMVTLNKQQFTRLT